MESNRLFLIENEKVLNLAFEDERDLCQCQRRCVYFSALYVSDLVIAYTGFHGKLILRYAVAHPQLAQPFTQPAPKPILLFRGHGSKLPLTAVPDRPIYRVILFLFISFGMTASPAAFQNMLYHIAEFIKEIRPPPVSENLWTLSYFFFINQKQKGYG